MTDMKKLIKWLMGYFFRAGFVLWAAQGYFISVLLFWEFCSCNRDLIRCSVFFAGSARFTSAHRYHFWQSPSRHFAVHLLSSCDFLDCQFWRFGATRKRPCVSFGHTTFAVIGTPRRWSFWLWIKSKKLKAGSIRVKIIKEYYRCRIDAHEVSTHENKL